MDIQFFKILFAVLMDCGLEYKKGESVTNMEFTGATDFTAALQMEEEQIKQMVSDVLKLKPTLVITEKVRPRLAALLRPQATFLCTQLDTERLAIAYAEIFPKNHCPIQSC